MSKVFESGILELVGINEQIDNGDMSASVELPLSPRSSVSGEILAVLLIATEDGSGAVLSSAGKLLVFDADPAHASGATDLTAGKHITMVGSIPVAATDWTTDANGGWAYIVDTPVAFHNLSSLYLVWLHEDATAINSAAGDDEQLEVNVWYRAEP